MKKVSLLNLESLDFKLNQYPKLNKINISGFQNIIMNPSLIVEHGMTILRKHFQEKQLE
jgi:hypothetical protein